MFLNVCFIFYTFKYRSFIAIDPPEDWVELLLSGERHACATRISLWNNDDNDNINDTEQLLHTWSQASL